MRQDCVFLRRLFIDNDPLDGFLDSPFPCAILDRPQNVFIYLLLIHALRCIYWALAAIQFGRCRALARDLLGER